MIPLRSYGRCYEKQLGPVITSGSSIQIVHRRPLVPPFVAYCPSVVFNHRYERVEFLEDFVFITCKGSEYLKVFKGTGLETYLSGNLKTVFLNAVSNGGKMVDSDIPYWETINTSLLTVTWPTILTSQLTPQDATVNSVNSGIPGAIGVGSKGHFTLTPYAT